MAHILVKIMDTSPHFAQEARISPKPLQEMIAIGEFFAVSL
jgi:hypothetical protein